MRFVKIFLLLALVAGSCQATLQKTLDLDQLVDESSAIVHARIVASRVDWNSSHTSIVTLYTVEAGRYLKGSLGSSFELVELGGQIGNLAMSVAGAPHFPAGEEVVLFLWTDGIYGRHQAIGFEQGVFRVRKDPASGLKLLNHSAPIRGAGEVSAAGMTPGRRAASRELNQFLSEVSDAVARVAAAQMAAKKAGVR